MAYLQAIPAVDIGWAMYAVAVLAGLLPEAFVVIQRRGFGRGGVGFGRRRGSFGVFRILFVLMFTTVLGPILLVALIAFLAFRFYTGRRYR